MPWRRISCAVLSFITAVLPEKSVRVNPQSRRMAARQLLYKRSLLHSYTPVPYIGVSLEFARDDSKANFLGDRKGRHYSTNY